MVLLISGKDKQKINLAITRICYRDYQGTRSNYLPVAVISHQGQMTTDGEGQGHYICDVRTKN